MSEVVFTIGGEAGQGVESSGAGFARALSREWRITSRGFAVVITRITSERVTRWCEPRLIRHIS